MKAGTNLLRSWTLVAPKKKSLHIRRDLDLFGFGAFSPVGFKFTVFVAVVDGNEYIG